MKLIRRRGRKSEILLLSNPPTFARSPVAFSAERRCCWRTRFGSVIGTLCVRCSSPFMRGLTFVFVLAPDELIGREIMFRENRDPVQFEKTDILPHGLCVEVSATVTDQRVPQTQSSSLSVMLVSVPYCEPGSKCQISSIEARRLKWNISLTSCSDERILFSEV